MSDDFPNEFSKFAIAIAQHDDRPKRSSRTRSTAHDGSPAAQHVPPNVAMPCLAGCGARAVLNASGRSETVHRRPSPSQPRAQHVLRHTSRDLIGAVALRVDHNVQDERWTVRKANPVNPLAVETWQLDPHVFPPTKPSTSPRSSQQDERRPDRGTAAPAHQHRERRRAGSGDLKVIASDVLDAATRLHPAMQHIIDKDVGLDRSSC